MAPDPSRGLRLLLLVACCLAPAQATLLPLDWLWSSKISGSTASPVSQPQGRPSPEPTAAPSTHVAPQHGPLEPRTVPASTRPASEGQAAAWSEAPAARDGPAAQAASTASLDPKEENVGGVGARILNVAQGIRSFVQLWDDAAPTGTSAAVGTPGPAPPVDPSALAGPSGDPQDSSAASWPSPGAPSLLGPRTAKAGALAVPAWPPLSPAPLRGPPVPPASPGRASLSPLPGGAPPWGSPRPPDLDTEAGAQQRGRPDSRRVLSLVMAAPSALPAGPSAWRFLVAAEPSPGDGSAWLSPRASPKGPGLTTRSALPGVSPPTPGGRCLPLTPTLPICGHLGIGRSWLPNHLRHGNSEEVQAAAQAWGGLLWTHGHPFLAWLFCLLLAPPCGPGPLPPLPPCRQFCEAVEDACWSRLDGARLPVACASLRAQEDGLCVFIGPAAGNAARPSPRCPAR